MVGAKYVWVLMGDYSDSWWQTNDSAIECTETQFEQGLEGYIATDILPITTSREQTVSGMVCCLAICYIAIIKHDCLLFEPHDHKYPPLIISIKVVSV